MGADSVDVLCEKSQFSEDEARWILNAGRRSGLLPRLHACGDSRTGAAGLAAELGCASADILHEATEEDIAALAQASVAAVVCPSPALQTSARPPVRDLLATLKREKLVLDWRKKQQARAEVRLTVEQALDSGLPESYSSTLYQRKCEEVFQHIYDSYFGQGQSIYTAA